MDNGDAIVRPAGRQEWKSPEGSWAGKVDPILDLLDVDMSELWDVVKARTDARAARDSPDQ
jgi:hypothetical protein